jgi:tape measure domain-containing protein
MPSKTVQPIAIELKIKGGEKLAALNRSFRDLSKQTKLSDRDITQATQDIIKFAQEVGNSEATIKGQIKAFEGLREQAAMGGKVYRELGVSIGNLKSTLRGSTDELEQQRAGFVKTGNAAKSSAADIKAVISQLEVLKGQARPGSSAFAQIAKDIDALQGRLKEVNIEVKKFNAGFETAQRPAMNLEKIQRQIGRLSEGMKTLNFTSNEYLQTQTRIALLGQVQSRSVGRQQVRANAEMFSSAAFQIFAQGPAGKLGLPNTAAALNLEISELQTQLANTTPGESYKRITQEIASKQADLNKILNSTADAYDRVAAAQSASARRAQKIADLQEYARGSGLAPGAGGYRDPETGAIIARGRGNIASRRAYRQRGQAFLDSINQEAQGLRQTLALPAAGQTTAPGTGLERSGGARSYIPESSRGFAQESFAQLQGPRQYLPVPALPPGFAEKLRRRNISEAESLRKLNEEKRVARRLDRELRAGVSKAKAANNGSISGINNLRAALEKQRNELPINTKRFKALTRQIEILDRQSEKASRRMSRRKFSPGKAAQVAGATISGGIFGGPEGFLGGAIGGALGGVGGSFAGAALGAQVGGIRQEIGRYSEMSAEIDRLRLGLAGASNDFGDFVKANIATEKASERLLIPLRTSFKIMTQLRANTVELGISVEDTTKIFEGITASVFKTGGSLAEVEGAMRAVIQILSKGTPQAEELRGQLGERLPAAILDFAKFTKRTPDELADALKKSRVTLGEFVDFAKNKFDENGQYLDGMADNAAYAGLRYEKALERVQLTTGRAFQAAGSNLQDFASRFLNGVDKIINKALELGLLDKGPAFFVEQVLSEEVTKADLETELLQKAAKLSDLRSKFPLDAAFKMVGGSKLKEEVDAIEQALKNLALFDKQTKERADQLAKDEKDALDKSRGQSFLDAIDQKESAIAQARIQLEEQAANIRKQAIEQAGQIEQDFAKQRLDSERDIQDLRRQLSYAEEDIAFGAEEARAVAGGADPEAFRVRKEIIELARQQKEDEISLDREILDEETERAKAIETFKVNNAKAINNANEKYAKQIGKIQQDYARNVAKIVEEGTGRAGKRLELSAKIAAEFIKRGKAEAALGELGVFIDELGTPRMLPGVELDTTQYNAVMGQNQLFIEANDKIKEFSEQLSAIPSATTVAAPAISSIGVNIGDLTGSLNSSKAALEATRRQVRGLSKDLSQAELNKKIGEIFAAKGEPVFARLRQAKDNAALQKQILRLREEGYSQGTATELISQENTAADALRNLDAARDQAAKEGLDVAPYNSIAESIRNAAEESRALTLAFENISVGDKLRNEVVDLRDELRDLADPANQITGAANAIGSAFSKSFTDAITGATSAKEALADFFKSVGSYFLDMAGQIIAKMVTIAILNSVAKLLPGLGGFNLGSTPSGAGGGDIFADIASRGGLRANGGPVSANTPYIVGERGPELMVPSTSGMVLSNRKTREQLERPQAFASTREQLNKMTTQSQPLDIRYESTVINNVEYVTAEQHRKGMTQAAERGRAMTLTTLQNSPRTRSKVGI